MKLTYILFALHIPRINKCITEFKETWKNYALSSEGNMSPYQLFTVGLLGAGRDCHNQSQGSIADVDIDSTGEYVSVPKMKSLCTSTTTHPYNKPCSDNGVAFFTELSMQ